MGVDLGDLVSKEELKLESLKGKKIGIDAYNTLYQFLTTIRGIDGEPLKNSQGEITSHLSGLFYRTSKLMEYGAMPVFVFDGKAPIEKEETRRKREEIKTDAEDKYKKALEDGDLEEARKFAGRTARLTEKMREEAKELLGYMGVPWIQAPSEAEGQCAVMVRKGELFGSVSQDYDSLLFGCPLLFRNVTVSGKRKALKSNYYYTVNPEMIYLEKTLKEIGIDRKQLIWLGLLLGTDFNEKIKGIGPKKGIEAVKGAGSFPEILEKLGAKIEYDWEKLENFFLEPPYEKLNFEYKDVQREKLMEFLIERYDFSLGRIEGTIERLISEREKKEKQKELSKWF